MAKWILLVFVCCELVSLFIAFIMRFCVDPEGHYSNFDDEEVCGGSLCCLMLSGTVSGFRMLFHGQGKDRAGVMRAEQHGGSSSDVENALSG